MTAKIKHLAAWIAGLAGMAVGMVWYSPFLFEARWMELSGMTPEKLEALLMKTGPAKIYGTAFVFSILQAYVMAWLLIKTQSLNILSSIRVSLALWLLVSLVMAGGILWEGMPIILLAINSGCYLIQVIVMAVILSLPIWRRQ